MAVGVIPSTPLMNRRMTGCVAGATARVCGLAAGTCRRYTRRAAWFSALSLCDMNMRTTIPVLLSLAAPFVCLAEDGYGPYGAQHAPSAYRAPANLAPGGAFIDRILPMPVPNGLRADTWGGTNVKPRVVENGLEDPAWSYWCMSVHRGADGLYQMFATRWPEADPRGHNAWPASRVVHATSAAPTGPFTVKQEVGPGHNVMCYRAKDGTYVLYVIGGAYTAKSVDGPWQKFDLKYDLRGAPAVPMSNHSFARREDGSVLMVSRGGHIWISEDGLKPFQKITATSLYPRIPGRFEDPVVWRDEVQYHLIVNDWYGRTAFYLRSPDGVNWTWDEGKAYDIEVVRHPDGSREGWHKLERPNVLQDSYGRATHLYLAAMDAPKDLDRGGDGHSSKVLALPLVVERRLQLLPAGNAPASNPPVQLRILAEPDFDPASVDIASLRFGPAQEVNYGKGAKALEARVTEEGLTVTFESMGGEFAPTDPVAKLLGKTRGGGLVLGYVRAPGHPGLTPLLSQRPAKLDQPEALAVMVENFGLVPSPPTPMRTTVRNAAGREHTADATVPALAPYAGATVSVPLPPGFLEPGTKGAVTTVLRPAGLRPVELRSAVEVPK